MKKLFPVVVLFLFILFGIGYYTGYIPDKELIRDVFSEKPNPTLPNNPRLLAAYQNRISKIQVEGQGVIIKVLKDDLEGSRHQRLLLRVNNQQSLLITHNIDLAPRIANPRVGEVVGFNGEYIWNNKGGLIHWTHKDPRGKHTDGWLMYQNKRYQ